MASQDAILSMFEAYFKQQQSEMTNKFDTFLKAINGQMMGALPSDTVKNPKLNVNPTSLVLSARSYPMEDPNAHIISTIRSMLLKYFMIVEDISSIIDTRLSQVVLGKPFVEISNMTHDLSLGIVKFSNGTDEIAYKMPYKIEQFNSLTDLEKEHAKALGPEYLTGLEEGEVTDEGGVTLYLMRRNPGVHRSFMWKILG
ncbi:hypothetical protein Tco_0464723 [Tanacetum coccineum]